MEFTTTIERSGGTTTGIVVPPEVVEELGGGRRPKVSATINGYTYRSSVASMGGRFMLGVSAEVRERAGVAGGDLVTVDLQLDTAPRVVEVPPDLAAALADDDAARASWEGLAYSHQLRHVLAIDGAKAAETRARRIAKTLEMLRNGAR